MENPLLATNKSAVIQGNSVVIDFKSKEEAEEAFKKLLKDSVNIYFIFIIIIIIFFRYRMYILLLRWIFKY